jgi:nucleoid-associated protein YgaU
MNIPPRGKDDLEKMMKMGAKPPEEAKLVADELSRAQQHLESLEAGKVKFLTEHTITADETLSHISLKYYGHATEPYWRLIYEANKDVIGSNPNIVRPGTVIKIPVLPEGMR